MSRWNGRQRRAARHRRGARHWRGGSHRRIERNRRICITGHPGARTTSYVSSGDAVSEASLTDAETRERWYFINAIEVVAPPDAFAVSVLGDSITDGYGVLDRFYRWPDFLTRAIKDDPEIADKVSVLNAGMGANNPLTGNADMDSGLDRFARDILARPKVKWVIVLHGVNDIGGQSDMGLVDQVTAAYQDIIDQSHQAGILAYGCPITPFGGHSYDAGEALAIRDAINEAGGGSAACSPAAGGRRPHGPARARSVVRHQRKGLHVQLTLFTPLTRLRGWHTGATGAAEKTDDRATRWNRAIWLAGRRGPLRLWLRLRIPPDGSCRGGRTRWGFCPTRCGVRGRSDRLPDRLR